MAEAYYLFFNHMELRDQSICLFKHGRNYLRHVVIITGSISR